MTNTRSPIEADAVVVTSDGGELGRVAAHTEHAFKVSAPMQPDYWLSNATVMALRDDKVVVGFEEHHLDEFRESSPEEAAQMKATQVLVQMHGETKAQFRELLGTVHPEAAGRLWNELQLAIEVHEQMEVQHLYNPAQEEVLPDELSGYASEHQTDVHGVEMMIEKTRGVDAGSPEWMQIVADVRDMLEEHMSEEEEDIFPEIAERWDDSRLIDAGSAMLAVKASRLGPAASTAA